MHLLVMHMLVEYFETNGNTNVLGTLDYDGHATFTGEVTIGVMHMLLVNFETNGNIPSVMDFGVTGASICTES